MIDPLVKKNGWLLAAGLAMLVYGAIEIGDSLYVFPLEAGWIPELYPPFVFQEIEKLLADNPLSLFPLFAFFCCRSYYRCFGCIQESDVGVLVGFVYLFCNGCLGGVLSTLGRRRYAGVLIYCSGVVNRTFG
ncbi:MAG: hypothetical protein JW908_09920 [Anaerolineales bacterium]|nr:hypothetical protein [Anaerolineales bacterium]